MNGIREDKKLESVQNANQPIGTSQKEEWRVVDGFPGYEVSSFGRVRSWLSRNIYKKRNDVPLMLKCRYVEKRGGYPQLDLKRSGKYNRLFVHRLVLDAFVGRRPKGHECRHLDGNPKNNNLNNLKWGTSQENSDDLEKHGGHMNRGENNGQSKLTNKEVRHIRFLLKNSNLSQVKIGKIYGVNGSLICNISQRKYWRHI